MKDKKMTGGLAVFGVGFLIHMISGFTYNYLVIYAGELLMIAGLFLVVLGLKHAGGKTGKKFLIGFVCLVSGFVIRIAAGFLYLEMLRYGTWLLTVIGLVLMIISLTGSDLEVCVTDGNSLIQALKLWDISRDPAYKPQDEEISHEIIKRKGINHSVQIAKNIVIVVLMIPMLICLFTQSYLLLLILCLIWVALQGWLDRFVRDIKGFASENIVRDALEEVFEIQEYQPFGSIPRSHLSAADFGIGNYNHVEGSDYVKGYYKGLPIELCDIRLSNRGSMSSDGGKWENYDDTVFRGFWMICDFERELSADIRLWEQLTLKVFRDKDELQTENETFNQKFHVESEIEEEAFYILTPHMIEYILEMDKKANGLTHIRFDRNGKVQIAVNTKRDAFEVGKGEVNATRLRKKFIREIRYITDLIDELRLVDTLYKK